MWGFYTRRPAGLTDGNTDAVKVLLHACVSTYVCVCDVVRAVVPKLKKHLAQNLDR